MKIDASRAVGAYAAVMTVAMAWMMFGANASPTGTRFETIDVQRINIREPDGTLRMTIASRDRMPGIIVAGHETPHPDRPQAGMIFYNDEGTENGGLVFSGALKDGKPTNLGALSFDRWRQDQTVALSSSEDGEDRQAGLAINDRPDQPVDFPTVARLMHQPPSAEREAAIRAAGAVVAPRAFLGRTSDKASVLALRDTDGRKRLELKVAADGRATIDFLDDQGHVTRSITDLSR
ncbi:hypothetical protein [Pseudoxanthomonas winnipegensis]|uniref:Uncharacterized protein n=1 Tax=Pseudoxanthomonas winnipegensis TaxID=2480810 RepID=A0A4Q8LEV5_9GAMM|nr:hypothetical protein [Pseudoxanthomonas winnipegensis]RZZ81033.1 hypothetical protein EA662_18730 [Pseudoxanthomonas winnipegensis]TAA27747.1 hypothetical protein EA661_13490 [Pseudoxanthomonas winnipegensis]TAA42083.1 hypothetical protein EAT51_07350 [Pseudoxanthomonas winnipegensis]TBV69572.1 hypothetical protein EYC46_19000 [Pseudoxanthomonas winnipegensis]